MRGQYKPSVPPLSSLFTLHGRSAIITGGSRGLGLEIAEGLGEAGASLMICARREEWLTPALAELGGKGFRAEGMVCDVAKPDEVQAVVDTTVAAFGSVDILVNNAGITRDKLIARMSEEDWQLVINVNLNSVFYCSKAASRVMAKQRSGRIISIASVVGLMGNAGQCNYSASKAGIVGFTKSLARELGARGVAVNAVAPGFIATAMTDVLSDEIKENLLKAIPMGKLGSAEDVAQAVLFLASPAAAYITGEVIRVDGGMAM